MPQSLARNVIRLLRLNTMFSPFRAGHSCCSALPGAMPRAVLSLPLQDEIQDERRNRDNQQPVAMLVSLAFLAALALLPGLGSSSRLTYHEAFVAQGAREILDSGNWEYPTIGGLPWLEKPPLPWWLVAGLGRCVGGVNETVARFPSALAAIAMVWGVAVLAARHYGPGIGLLAGAVQATTAWTVTRGRLAEADILLACLITWAIVAFERVEAVGAPRRHLGRWAFFALLGATSLVKGIGFGAVLILAVVAAVLAWRRDGAALRRLCFFRGWVLAAVLATSWPLLMWARHGSGALALWTMHVTDRLAAHPGMFASEPWWKYVLGILAQALPWTPLALAGAWRSLGRAVLGGVGERVPQAVVDGDRLLWAWTVMPLALLSLATVKNAHYAIAAQVPWSIWAALALARLGERLHQRGWDRNSLHRGARAGFTAMALAYGLGFWLLGPRFDRRGVEWAFYESAGRQLDASMPLTLLYDDWDRNPYESPFGSIPHDLAVRLFYLGRASSWEARPDALLARECDRGQARPEFAVIGRDRDLPALERLGRVEVMARGPALRYDRTYTLFRVTANRNEARSIGRFPARAIY
jgi:4-amino-4-deoxy-L-arabinose transferase-like glycosyltransferase